MSAPATQNNTPNGTNTQQSSSKGRGGNSRSNTPVDANRGEGDANYQGKQNQRGTNPEYKKGWRQKSAPENGANGQGQAQGQGGQDRRKGKDRAPEQGGNDPNVATANGDKKHDVREKRPDRGGRRRGDKDFNNQAQVQQQQEQPAQPQQPPRAPQVDQARIEDARRISTLISNQEQLSQEQIATIGAVGRVVEFGEADIYEALQQSNWDQQKAINMLMEGSQANSWSDVVRRPKERPTPAPQPQPDRRQSERTVRPPRERQRANGQASHNERQHAQQQAPQQQQQVPQPQAQQASQQQQAHQQQAHLQQQQAHQQQQQQLQQQQQQFQQQQLQLQQQHYQQFPQQHLLQQPLHHQQIHPMQQQQIQVYSPADGEALIMELSKAIGSQLDDIAKKSKLLLEMQNELESIHAAGKEKLTQLHAEKSQLIDKKENLQAQLAMVSERLVEVDKGIEEAEAQKLYKLQSWQSKSATHGLINY